MEYNCGAITVPTLRLHVGASTAETHLFAKFISAIDVYTTREYGDIADIFTKITYPDYPDPDQTNDLFGLLKRSDKEADRGNNCHMVNCH